jgi:hypothetical protein
MSLCQVTSLERGRGVYRVYHAYNRDEHDRQSLPTEPEGADNQKYQARTRCPLRQDSPRTVRIPLFSC